jgi:hypothetical protein
MSSIWIPIRKLLGIFYTVLVSSLTHYVVFLFYELKCDFYISVTFLTGSIRSSDDHLVLGCEISTNSAFSQCDY